MAAKKIVFITLTVALSVAVIAILIFAIREIQAKQTAVRRDLFVGNNGTNALLNSDSEKAIHDTYYPSTTPSSTPRCIDELSTKAHTSTLGRLSRVVEQDITLSHSRTSSVDIAFPLLSTFAHVDANTATAMFIQAGLQCMSRRATESSFSDEDHEDEIYPVHRAQTQSMEIQRGALLTLEVLHTPEVVISTIPVDKEARYVSLSTNASLFHVQAPSILVTHPSTSTIESSTSNVATGGRLEFDDSEKRSSVEQFIVLYWSTAEM
ncbi:uncharacterized protein BT62DRAFT_919696 [Guyanagaster necrorhizus]|uniref:Uncharacterized protein n=1 Tax=Guyanagaster necrorhizus TaxID=856835 RepID=A0A9P7VS19_9AGAR|nr:uncharacterized protein BT62DRAFT_919696 [Guyanagaster necrorhizus MCA 3950]KAG7446383.1 hypothetical protein BT62DRAFT_919696 [Guyanagaster necrorhizus MCA 3950]